MKKVNKTHSYTENDASTLLKMDGVADNSELYLTKRAVRFSVSKSLSQNIFKEINFTQLGQSYCIKSNWEVKRDVQDFVYGQVKVYYVEN